MELYTYMYIHTLVHTFLSIPSAPRCPHFEISEGMFAQLKAIRLSAVDPTGSKPLATVCKTY